MVARLKGWMVFVLLVGTMAYCIADLPVGRPAVHEGLVCPGLEGLSGA